MHGPEELLTSQVMFLVAYPVLLVAETLNMQRLNIYCHRSHS